MTTAAPMGAIVRLGFVPLLGADAVFYVVFGVFVLAFAVLVVVTTRWAVRRDRAGRAAWVERQRAREAEGSVEPSAARMNGHARGRRDQHGGNPRRQG